MDMKTTNVKYENIPVKEVKVKHPIPAPHPPIPAPERKGMLTIQLDERDWSVFQSVFGDDDTAAAAVEIVNGAPPEIQILVMQVLMMIEKEEA